MPPNQSWRDDRFPPVNEGCGEVRHVPPTPDAREGRNRRDGAVIWFFWSRLVAGFCSRLVAGSGRVACRSSVLEPDAALRTRCLQRHRVAGSSPVDPRRRRPHEEGRPEIALVSSSSSLELGTFNKGRGHHFFWVFVCACVCVCVCLWARLQVELFKCFVHTCISFSRFNSAL